MANAIELLPHGYPCVFLLTLNNQKSIHSITKHTQQTNYNNINKLSQQVRYFQISIVSNKCA